MEKRYNETDFTNILQENIQRFDDAGRKRMNWMARSYEIDMCNGPLLKKILIFSLPLMASGILQLLFNAADLIVVGKYTGSDAMAAVGATTALINLLVNLFIGISVGTNVLIAQFYGAQKADDVEQTVHTSILAAAIGGVIMIFVGIGVARPVLELMGTPENILDQAVLYMSIYFVGMPASMLYNFGAAILRAIGDTRRPLYFLVVAGLVNVVFNLFFVLLLHMGVAGVACATVISQTISAGLILLCLHHTPGMCHLEFSQLRIHKGKLGDILRIGLPAGLQSVIFNISNILIQSSVNSFGFIAVAGNTAASNIEGFVYTSMNSIYQTALSFTSQNYGAGNYKRIDRILGQCLIIVSVIGLVLGQGAFLAGHQLLGIYSSDQEVITYGISRLGVVSASYFLCGLMDVLAGTIRGVGYSILPMLVSLTGACAFRVLWIFTIFQWEHTLFILYISYPISWILTAATHMLCYLIIRKKRFHLPVQ